MTGYRDQFVKLGPLGTAAFVAGQMWETVIERTAARELVTRIADEALPSGGGDEDSGLLDRRHRLRPFARREKHVVCTAARRLRGGIEGGRNPFRLRSPHALWRVEAERDRFQEHGRLSSTGSKAVLKAVNALCVGLHDHAGRLVAAFGIPDRLPGEGIARKPSTA